MLLQLDRIGNHFSTLAFSKLISYNSYKSESVFGCIWSGVIFSMLLFYLFKQPFFFPQNKSSFLFFCSFPFIMLELFLKLIYIDPLKVNNQMQESRGAPAKKPAPDYFLWGLKFYILREFACMGKPRFAGTWWWSRNTKRTGCRLLNDQLLKWTARLVLSSCWSVWILGFACIRHCLMFACSRVCQYVVFDLQVNHEIQNTIFVLQRGGEEWARKGSYRRKLCFIRRLWKMIWWGTLEEFYIMILIKKKWFSFLCYAYSSLHVKHLNTSTIVWSQVEAFWPWLCHFSGLNLNSNSLPKEHCP